MPSLNTTQPEAIIHGTEITLQAQLTGGGAYVVVAEIQELQYDEDQKLEAVPVLGSRRIGRRRGSLEVKGSFKGYLVNQVVRSLWMGLTPAVSGGGSPIYHSAIPFSRYNLVVASTNANSPNLVFINVTFEKDAIKWSAEKITDETVSFLAEDIIGQ